MDRKITEEEEISITSADLEEVKKLPEINPRNFFRLHLFWIFSCCFIRGRKYPNPISILWILLMVLYWLQNAWSILFLPIPMRDKMVNILVIICTPLVPVYFLNQHRDKFERGFVALQECEYYMSQDPVRRAALIRALKTAKRISYIYVGTFFYAAISNTLFVFLKGESAYKIWWPFDPTSSPYYAYSVFVHELVIATTTGMISPILDTLPACIIMIMISWIQCLDEDLRGVRNVEELKQHIRFHQRFKKVFEDFHTAYSAIFFARYLANSIVLCILVCINTVARPPDQTTGNDISGAMASLVYVFQLFFPSYFAQQLKSRTEDLLRAIYVHDWAEKGRDFTQTHLIFMQILQNPVKVVAGGLYELNMENFREIIMAAYRLFSVVLNIV